ncbi:MAG: tetratricopeptide repeat protein [Balneola sp.]
MRQYSRTVLIALILCISFVLSGNEVTYAKHSEKLFYQASADTSLVISLLKDSEELVYRGRFEAAVKNIDRARFMSDSLDYQYGLALSDVRLADAFMNVQQIDTAVTILKNAIEQYPNSRLKPHFYNLLGASYNYQGQPALSIKTYNEGLELIHLLPEEKKDYITAVMLLNMASAYQKLGDKSNTFSSYLKGLNFAESSTDTSFMIITLNNLGDAYNNYEEFDKAEYYLNKALDLALIKGYKNELLRIYLNLGITKSSLELTDEALDFYNKALVLNKEVRPDTPPFQITFNLGSLYLKMSDFDKAKSYFEESLQYCMELNIPQGAYYNYKGLGDLYDKFSQPEKAIDWYLKAFEVAKGLNFNEAIYELNESLYSTYKQVGSLDKALFHLERYKSLADSISKAESEQMLSDLESKIELDRQTEINRLLEEKQAEQEGQLRLRQRLNIAAGVLILIILLFLFFLYKSGKERKRVNKILNQQKKELEELNQAKDKLFAIVAHDLRSPMASMQGILYLINNSELTIKEIEELAIELEPTLQKNVDTLDDLLAWARKQMSGIRMSLKSIDTTSIIDDVISKQKFQVEAKNIQLVSNIKEETLAYVDESAFRLVIRNLLANSIKFTEPGGTIIFNTDEDSGHIIYSIKDTGIGIPDKLQHSIFEDNAETRKGTHAEIGNGFGLSLCKEFVEHMNGEIYFESKEGEGSVFYVKLPKK